MSVRQPEGLDLCERARGYKIKASRHDGNDVVAVYEAAREAIAHTRSGAGPYFLEFMTYRWLEHVGPFFDHEFGRTYRTQDEVSVWMERCPVKNCEGKLTALGVTDETLGSLRDEVALEIDAAVSRAKESPWPNPQQIHDYV